jgi:hypothetical protein
LRATPGFLAFEQLPAVEGQQDLWTQIVKFYSRRASAQWAQSPQLAGLLQEIEPFTQDAEVAAVRTGTRDWLNFGVSTTAGPVALENHVRGLARGAASLRLREGRGQQPGWVVVGLECSQPAEVLR